MDWIERLNDAVKYIEENLSSDIDYSLAAQRACCSLYHFQRMFSYISGIPLSEYVRRRKMSLAAADIISGGKVIDTALKYGYSSPTAFNRAFKSVHGVAPSDARSCGTVLKSYPPLVFKITVKGVYEMNYRIEKKDAFRVAGVSSPMETDMEKNFSVIPLFWDKCLSNGTIEKLCGIMDDNRKGVLGISKCVCDEGWKYYIAVFAGVSCEGFETLDIPSRTWAVFEGSGKSPEAIQELEKRIFTEWLPSSGYEYDQWPDVEFYISPDPQNAVFEIWIPVKKSSVNK